jgi:arginase
MEQTVAVIGAPTDYGTNRRGVDMGPSAIRYAGLADTLAAAGVECLDEGDLAATRTEAAAADSDCEGFAGEGCARFLPEIEDVCRRLADRVADARAAGRLPLVLGGDHSVAIGTLGGTGRDAEVGVLWFDAHGDYNTPATSPSGNVHGMSLAAALGRGAFGEAGLEWARTPGLDARNLAWIGLRDLDPEERTAIRESDATAFTMSDVDERGITDVVEAALDVATAGGVEGIHLSFDLDFLDPNEAPGVGTPVRGGATYREAHAALELVADRDCLRSLEFVEVNPTLDERNRTAELTVELAVSALGRRVL